MYFALLEDLSPINQVFSLVATIGVLFFLLVIFLDSSDDFELKSDWRDKK